MWEKSSFQHVCVYECMNTWTFLCCYIQTAACLHHAGRKVAYCTWICTYMHYTLAYACIYLTVTKTHILVHVLTNIRYIYIISILPVSFKTCDCHNHNHKFYFNRKLISFYNLIGNVVLDKSIISSIWKHLFGRVCQSKIVSWWYLC